MKFLNKYAFMSWESELEGMLGIFANEPSDLKRDVSTGGINTNVGRCTRSDNDMYPFQLEETILQYKIFYPFLFTSFWEDYVLGKTIYYHDGSGEWKKVPLGTLMCDQTYWSNDYTYSDEAPPGFQDEDSEYCTWGDLAFWLVHGYGLVRLSDGTVSRFVGFSAEQWDLPVPNDYLIRGFNMTEWVPPLKSLLASYD